MVARPFASIRTWLGRYRTSPPLIVSKTPPISYTRFGTNPAKSSWMVHGHWGGFPRVLKTLTIGRFGCVGVAVTVLVGVRVGVEVCVGTVVCVGVLEGVAVFVVVGVNVGVFDGATVCVAVGGGAVGVEVGGAGVGVCVGTEVGVYGRHDPFTHRPSAHSLSVQQARSGMQI